MTTTDLLIEVAKDIWPLTLGASLAALWLGFEFIRWLFKRRK